MQRWMTGLLVVIVTACGAERAPERVETTSPPPSVMGSTREKGGELVPLEAQATPIAAGNRVAWTRAHVERLWRDALAWIAAAERRAEEVAAGQDYTQPAPPAAASSSIDTGHPCPDEYEAAIYEVFPDDGPWMVEIAWRESHCTPDAYNPVPCNEDGSHASGFVQVCYPLHKAQMEQAGCSNIFELWCNLRTARVLYDQRGRQPWDL